MQQRNHVRPRRKRLKNEQKQKDNQCGSMFILSTSGLQTKQ